MVCGALLLGSVIGSSGRGRRPGHRSARCCCHDVGPGFTLTERATWQLRLADPDVRRATTPAPTSGFTITDPPGVRAMFQVFSAKTPGFDVVPEPSLDLAAWFVPTGTKLGDGVRLADLRRAGSHLRLHRHGRRGPAAIEPVLVRSRTWPTGRSPWPAANRRQPHNDRCGSDRAQTQKSWRCCPPKRRQGYGLTTSATVTGNDELKGTEGVEAERRRLPQQALVTTAPGLEPTTPDRSPAPSA